MREQDDDNTITMTTSVEGASDKELSTIRLEEDALPLTVVRQRKRNRRRRAKQQHQLPAKATDVKKQ